MSIPESGKPKKMGMIPPHQCIPVHRQLLGHANPGVGLGHIDGEFRENWDISIYFNDLN